MTNSADNSPNEAITEHDARPLGVAIGRDQLRPGDKCTVTVEAQMQGLPTGSMLTFRGVFYRGVEDGRLRFDSEIDSHYFASHEIVRVALAEE